MKRYLSIVLAIALLAFSVPTSLAAGSAIMEFSKTAETIAAGGTTSVNLVLRKYDNSAYALGILQGLVKIPSQFDLTITPGKLGTGDVAVGNPGPGYVLLYNDAGLASLNAENPLITFTLTANATAVPGETYSVEIAKGAEDNLFIDTNFDQLFDVDLGGDFAITIEDDVPPPPPAFTFGVIGSGTDVAPYVYSVTKPEGYVGDFYVVAQTYNADGEFAGMAAYKNSAAGEITIGSGLTAKFMLISAFDDTATVLAASVVK